VGKGHLWDLLPSVSIFNFTVTRKNRDLPMKIQELPPAIINQLFVCFLLVPLGGKTIAQTKR